LAYVAFSLIQTAALPKEVHNVLEIQLPAWAEVTGSPSPHSEDEERIAVERTEGPTLHVFLIARRIKATIQREGGHSWLTEVVWCGQGPDRCEDLWKRNDEAWRSDKATANHTGYAVYRDSLGLSPASWTNSVPALAAGKKAWDKGLCTDGLCFLASVKDSSVATVAARPDGSVNWWDASYVLGGSLEKELVHSYRYLLEKGRPVPKTGGK
jgi:hypothetical protein